MSTLTTNNLNWNTKPPVEKSVREKLLKAIPGLHPVVASILLQRGLDNFDSIRAFFNPALENIDNYGELKDCAKASERLQNALKADQKILIYGDYDVDGTCSVSSFYLFLKNLNARVETYIPDRYSEGYGVSAAGVDYALREKFDVLITVDCGIRATDQLGRAQGSGMDVIICDHHLPGDAVPSVFAILNPQQADCNFQGKELCGCGVALMLLRELSRKIGKTESWKEYLGLTAIATCCDIVPLKGINRILVSAGLEQLNAQRSVGVDALLKKASFSGQLRVGDLVFKIGPRINAAGRLDHARQAVKLLTSDDPDEAMALAEAIEKLNTERRTMDKNVTQEAQKHLAEADPTFERHSTVVHSDGWHKGIIGIVASRLIEFCYRPTIVLTEIDGMLTGSARSVEGVHLYNALEACSEHLTKFGGHKAAAGLSLTKASLDGFMAAFETAIIEETEGKRRLPGLKIDLLLNFSEWNNARSDKFLLQLDRLRPYGPYNMPPVFATENCMAKYPKLIGKGSDHLKFSVFQADKSRQSIGVIAFNMPQHYEALAMGKKFRMAYTIEENEWKGSKNIQLVAKDIVIEG